MASPACRACGLPGLRSAFAVSGHRFLRCRHCSSLQLAVVPEPGELEAIYRGRDYFANPAFGDGSYHGYRDYDADWEQIVDKFDGVLARLEAQRAPGDLLDVGSGPGAMLAAASARGWSAQGIDLNPWAVERAREGHGLDVREGSLPDPELAGGQFDAVTMMDLIEHVEDPLALLREARRLLRAGGAIAVLTPDAGSPVSRMLGRRWPEAVRAPEHLALFSARGLAALMRRAGFEPVGYHSVGKTSTLATLATDVAPAAPRVMGPLAKRLQRSGLGRRTLAFDPVTKLCMYGHLAPDPAPTRSGARRRRAPRVPRLPRKAPRATPDETVLDDLGALSGATGLRDWLFDRVCGRLVRGAVAEVGSGIGTFTSLLLDGADSVLALEPDPACRSALQRSLGSDPRLRVVAEGVPGSRALAEAGAGAGAGGFDLVVCQNVLEHVDDHVAALAEMGAALRPGGTLALLVPAGPRLYGVLDLAYGHRRRYTGEEVAALLERAGLAVERVEHVNLLGVAGWWVSNRTGRKRIGRGAVAVYEALLRAWRPLEDRLRPSFGLSLVAHAKRPQPGS